MQQLLTIAISFPTVLYSFLLVLCLVYWLLVIVGTLDLDMLDGADGALKGGADALAGAKGGLEGIAAAGKGGLEGIAAAGKGGVEGVIGAGKAGLEGLAAGDGLGDGLDAHSDLGSGGLLSVIYGTLRLRSAPVTVVASFFSLFAWLISTLVVQTIGPPGFLVAALLFAGSGLASLFLTSLVIRPLAPIFELGKGKTQADLIGKVALVTSGSVTPRFGQAILDEGGDSLTLHVRADDSSNIKRGDRVLLIESDPETGGFMVEKLPGADDLLLDTRPQSAVEKEALAEAEAALAEAEAAFAESSAKKPSDQV